MAITIFDTHKFVRRLEQAGVPLEQAEVQAEVLTEAFNVNLEKLVTKDYLAAQFAEQQAHMEKRFAQIDCKFTVLYWMLATVIASTVIPFLQEIL